MGNSGGRLFEMSDVLRDTLDELHIILFILNRQKEVIDDLEGIEYLGLSGVKKKIERYISRIQCLRDEADRTNRSVSRNIQSITAN